MFCLLQMRNLAVLAVHEAIGCLLRRLMYAQDVSLVSQFCTVSAGQVTELTSRSHLQS